MITTMGHKRLCLNIIVEDERARRRNKLATEKCMHIVFQCVVVPLINDCDKCGGTFMGVNEEAGGHICICICISCIWIYY
jgi:hypothetical protein